MSDRERRSSMYAQLRQGLITSISADNSPAWRNWLLAAIAAWSVFTHIIGIISGEPQSWLVEGWGVVAEWIEHGLILGGMVFALTWAVAALVHRYRSRSTSRVSNQRSAP
ncbi:hypothetical protein [Nonomuraea typhae]|uniref:hypothetical protein n=1 Tax=Nonomuraea typhae TaxID=2603600 RepID=UPI0012FC1C8D|nr:hypothetical protein [Nonomuraea typhae]